MQDTITTMFCLCDDFLKANGCQDDPQCRVSTAQVMTTPLVAAAFFGGNLALARRFLVAHGYFFWSRMATFSGRAWLLFLVAHGYFAQDLSASRFCRRLHAIRQELWHILFRVLGAVFGQANPTGHYVVDSVPIPVCDNIRIRRCKLLTGPAHRG